MNNTVTIAEFLRANVRKRFDLWLNVRLRVRYDKSMTIARIKLNVIFTMIVFFSRESVRRYERQKKNIGKVLFFILVCLFIRRTLFK